MGKEPEDSGAELGGEERSLRGLGRIGHNFSGGKPQDRESPLHHAFGIQSPKPSLPVGEPLDLLGQFSPRELAHPARPNPDFLFGLPQLAKASAEKTLFRFLSQVRFPPKRRLAP